MVKVQTIDYAKLRVRDISRLEARRMRIRGTAAYVSDSDRRAYGSKDYLLVREPTNPHDASAIAVYGRQRKLGYVPAATAAALAPLFDQLDGDGFVVVGASTVAGSIRLWVDLPRVPA